MTMKCNSLLLFLPVLILVNLVMTVAAAAERPNIIFLMTDDQRCDNLGCYGRAEFKTPNIDKLAKQGVLFENAF